MKAQGTLLHKDPVCGMQVSPNTAAEVVQYQGKSYYFCSAHCREAFEAEPQEYVRGWQKGGTAREDKGQDDERRGLV